MAQRLENMVLESVDLCERGANPRAHFKLMKSADNTGGGEHETVEKSAIQKLADSLMEAIGKAIPKSGKIEKAALDAIQGESFDMTYALHESISSIMQDPGQSPVEKSAAMTESLEQFNEEITKRFDDWSDGTAPAENLISEARREALQKSAEHIETLLKSDGVPTFDSAFAVVDITDNLWRANDTLGQLFRTIMSDESVTDKTAALNAAVDSYSKFIKSKINGINVAKALGMEMECEDDDTEEGAEGTPKKKKGVKKEAIPAGDDSIIIKGGTDNMPNVEIDVAKMTPEEVAVLKSFQEKYGKPTEVQTPAAAPVVPAVTTPAPASPLDTVVKSLQETIAKMQEKEAMNEISEVAKKYEGIGQKPDELAKTLYTLKKSDEAGYNSLIASLDSVVAMQQSSGIFKEIGSNGTGGQMATDLQGKVAEVQKANPGLNYAQAVKKAYEENPGLDEFNGRLK